MDQFLLFALIGLGVGAAYAALALGLVITYKGIGVINFAAGAMGMWSAYVYDEFDKTGDVVLPLVVVPHRVPLMEDPPLVLALGVALFSAGILALVAHFLVFRPLRTAPVLAKVVASVGLMLAIQALVVLQFGSETRRVAPILPTEAITVAGQPVPRDRIILAALALAMAAALWAFFRFTRIGLAARAAAESERSASLAGYSPQRLAGVTWLISGLVVGLMLTLVAPTLGLNTTTFVLLIVPALACALVGRLSSLGAVTAAGLGLGALQAEIGFYSSKSWWPEWAKTGLNDAVPFIIVVIALCVVGRKLPTRGATAVDALPAVIIPRNRPLVVASMAMAGFALLAMTSGTYRFGVITSMIFTIVALSMVVLTGFLGQISFAQAALAGASGFGLSKLTTSVGVSFPFSLVLAALIAVVVGVVVGLPALRVRGAQLAVVTLALAVAIERFLLQNSNFTSPAGNPIEPPNIFGLDLSVRDGGNIARLEFGVLVLVVLIATVLIAGNLIRGAVGRRFLAIRSNERAGAGVGINVATTKLLGFALSAALAGIGGALLGYSRGQLSAESFTVMVGVSYVAYAYLGGITSISGALVAGMMAPLGLSYVFATDVFHGFANIYLLMTGVGLIVSAIFNPIGIAGVVRHQWLRHRGDPAKPESRERPVDSASVALRLPGVPESSNLKIRGLGVRYGGLHAVRDVDIDCRSGEIVGLIGPNGAGKTSLIDAITGFTPYQGSVHLSGCRLDGLQAHARSKAGLSRTWQSMELFGDLTLADNLRVAVEEVTLRSVALDIVRPTRSVDYSPVDAALQAVGLAGLASSSVDELSLGQQKMAGVARALASGPSVVLLDEPAAGLDTVESRRLGEQLRTIANSGPAILLVDHDMDLVLDLCDRVYVMVFGAIVATGSPEEVRKHQDVIDAYLGTVAPPSPSTGSHTAGAGVGA